MTLPTPFSYTQFDGDGSETSFSFTWDYISKEDVKVYLDTTLVNEGTANNEWQWDGAKKIKMGTAPATGTKLTIRRETPEDKRIVQWTDGSHLIADDLNKSDRQWLYLAEEHHDVIIRIVWGLPPVPGPGLPDDLFGLWNRLARNKDSNKGTSNEVAQTIDKTDQLKGDAVPGSVQNGEDSYVLTLGAISERLDLIKGDGSSYPGTGNTGQLGKLRVNSSNKLFFWDQSLSTPAWVEIVGGEKGAAATIAVGTTTTLDAGKDATVSNSGTSSAAVFNFGIPKGAKGDDGDPGSKGDPGPAPGLQDPATAVSNVANKSDGSVGDATVSVAQDASNDLKFTFGIPVGIKGDKGDPGTGGKVDEVQAGNGIAVDNTDNTKPKVSVKLDGNTLTNGASGLKVTTPFNEPPDDNKTYGRKTNSGTSSWVEVTGGGSGTLTGIDAGSGIVVTDGSTATPKVAVDYGEGLEPSDGTDAAKARVKLDGNTITRGASGIKVTTPFVEPTSDGSFVRKKDGTTFSWETAPDAGVPEPTTDGTFARKKDGTSFTWETFTEGFADVSSDGSFVRTRSGGTNSWTTAPTSPWQESTTGGIVTISTGTNTDTVLVQQVRSAVQELSANGAATPDFRAANVIRLSGTGMTINAPDNPGVGQSGIFYIHGTATVNSWNTVYKWPGGTQLTSKTGYTIVPFYVFDATHIRMGAATEDIRD